MLLGVVMFAVTGGSLVGPILPAMMELEGATSKNIGLALSSYTFAAMVATLALEPLADRFGRKTIIVPSVILFGICGLLITSADVKRPERENWKGKGGAMFQPTALIKQMLRRKKTPGHE